MFLLILNHLTDIVIGSYCRISVFQLFGDTNMNSCVGVPSASLWYGSKSHLMIIGNDIVERSCEVYCCSGDSEVAILYEDLDQVLLRKCSF